LQANLPDANSVAPMLKFKQETPVAEAEKAQEPVPASAPRPPMNLMPMTSLANLAASVGNTQAEPATQAETKPSPAAELTVEAGKPRPLNIVRRPLQLKP
jgi:hypothetical protein